MTASHLVLSILLSASSALAVAQPFTVVRGVKSNAKASVLFEVGTTKVLRNADAKDQDFKDLYWVNTSGMSATALPLKKFGEVMHAEKGSFAIVRLDDADALQLSRKLHESGMACGALIKLNGDVLAFLDQAASPIPRTPVSESIAFVQGAVAKVDPARIQKTVEELSAIDTRFHRSATGQAVAEQLAVQYRQLAQGRQDVTIETYDHGNDTPQPSLIVRIQGQKAPTEMIILGSHIDSVNWDDGTGSRSPGSDDNASGTATNMEVFRLLMEGGIRLDRTLEIHGYAAEEAGLVGSQNMASRYKSANKNVIAMVQHDMNLYRGNGPDRIYLVEQH